MRILLILTALMVTLTAKINAQSPTPLTCPPLYNGGVVCQEAKDFRVDKKVQTPKDGSFVDEIPQNEALVAPEHTMIFRILVTNKTDKTLRNISLTDTLPDFIQFVKSDGTTKQNKQQITYSIPSLDAQKTNTMNIQVKVANQATLPKTSPVCIANQVEAKMGIFTSQIAKDFVTFCVDPSAMASTASSSQQSEPAFPGQTKGGQTLSETNTASNMTKGGQTVYPAPSTTTNPNTGPELIGLIALLPAGYIGFLLRKTMH
ncbi:MAG: hypothetical protein Q8Q49_03760 [bacterium]|nr:hypothetical protein [bacterium]